MFDWSASPGQDSVGEAVSLELSSQAGFPQLLEQPDEVVGVQLEGFPCAMKQRLIM